jgi:hypothetical protein
MIKVREEVFKYYFLFVQERMSIFWKRYEGQTENLTNDAILQTYKFTNVYRVLDRVTQYLLRNVIYTNESGLSEQDVLFRILIFKIFNKIETWEFLEQELGETLKVSNFDVDWLKDLLAERIKETPIFNAAYMMTGSHAKYDHFNSKHEKWLRMVEKEFIKDKFFDKIIEAKSLNQVYDLLLQKSFIGGFLAYQYAIDFNYSPVLNFDENSFVKAGIGAIRGIKKCFVESKAYSYEDCIKFTQENFEVYQNKFDYTNFKDLHGRKPTLIDLQNCFCETDKYLRVEMPELQVDNVKIKQKFTPMGKGITYFFPPKWDINQFVKS